VILVDGDDNALGRQEKLAAHRSGELHRAFSVYVLNAQDELLIQKRADGKYHTPGLWTNTCDGHPRPGEDTVDAARARLVEEMGFDCALKDAFQFRYRAELDRGLIEHEFDHVCIGRFDGEPEPDPEEASAYRWIDLETLAGDIRAHPERYAPWFSLSFHRVVSVLRDGIG
jgi:isopentenyl-diphosphate delta-isomerase